MVFTAPAVHYSALATLPPELTLSKSQHSVNQTASVRFTLSRIFKRLLYNEHTIATEIEQHIQRPKRDLYVSETKLKENNNGTSTLVKGPYDKSGSRATTEQESARAIPSLIESLERLPFTEPYFSAPSKNGELPHFELSAYHKHCIHQPKLIDEKKDHRVAPSTTQHPESSPTNSSLSSSFNEHHSDLAHGRSPNVIDQQSPIKCNHKKIHSTTTLPASSSIENRIGLQYASRRNTVTNSLHAQQQTQRLRRLHSKSTIRSHSHATKTLSITHEKKSVSPTTISSSIAHRIELLKQTMHNNQLEFYQWKSEKICPLQSSSSHAMIGAISKETQTNRAQLQSSEIHHIHHHHIHSASFLSIEWRTYLSIMFTLTIMFLLLLQLPTISF